MENFSAPITTIDQIQDKDTDVYEGGIQPNYLNSVEGMQGEETSTQDSTSVSCAKGHPQPNPSPTAPAETENTAENNSNYVDNSSPTTTSSSNNDGQTTTTVSLGLTVDDSPPGGTVNNDSHDPIELASGIDSGLDSLEDEFSNDENFYEVDENGYRVLKEEVAQRIFEDLANYFGVLMMIALYYDTKTDALRRFRDSFSSLPPDENRGNVSSISQSVAEGQQAIMKNFHKAVMLVAESIQTNNNEVYKKATEKAESYDNNTNDFVKVISCGQIDKDEEKKMQMMKTAHKNYEKALDATLSSLKAIVGGSFHGIRNIDGKNNKVDVDKDGDRVFSELGRAEDYITKDSNGYIDLPKIKQWVVDLRETLVSLLAYNKITIASFVTREEIVRMWEEAMTGKDAGSTKGKAAESVVESDSARCLSLFDKFGSNFIQAKNHYNEARYLQKQINKLNKAGGLKVLATLMAYVAIALGTLGCIFGGVGLPLAAAGVAALGALASYGGQKVADSVKDEYKPSSNSNLVGGSGLSDSNKAARKNLRDSFATTAAELEREQKELDRQVDNNLLTKVKDGYYAVEYAQVANLNQQLAGLNDALRLIMQAQRQAAAVARAFSRPFSKIRSASNSPLLQSSLELSLNQSEVRFQGLTSNLNDIVEAHNWERAQEINMEKATTVLVTQICVAAAAAIIGGAVGGAVGGAAVAGTGALLGWGIGMSVGAAIGGLITAAWGTFGGSDSCSYGVTFNPNISAFEKAYRRGQSAGIGRTIDMDINQVYSDMLAFDKSIANAGSANYGHNYGAINSDYIGNLQKQLNMLQNALLLIVSSYEKASKVNANLSRGFGFSSVEVTDLSSAAKGVISANSKNFEYVQRLLGEKIQVQNRAAAASEELHAANWKFGLSIAIAVVMAACSAASASVAYFISPAINLATSLFDIFNSLDSSDQGYADFAKYVNNDKETDNRGKVGEDEEEIAIQVAKELDNLQTELITLNNDFIINAGNDNWSTDMANVAKNQLAIKELYQVLETLASVRGLISKVTSKLAKVGTIESSSSGIALQTMEQSALVQLDTQVQAIQTVVQRHNQMNAQARGMYQGITQATLAVISMALTGAKLGKSAGIEKAQTNVNKGTQNAEHEKTIKNNTKAMKNMTIVSACFSVLGSLSDLLTGMIYDALQDKSAIDKRGAEENKERAQNQQKRVKEAGDLAAKMGALEAATQATRLNTAVINSNIQAMAYGPPTEDELVAAMSNTVESVKQGTADIVDAYKAENKAASYVEFSKMQRAISGVLSLFMQKETAIVASQMLFVNVLKNYQVCLEKFKVDPENQETRTNLQSAYLNMIEAQLSANKALLEFIPSQTLAELAEKTEKLKQMKAEALGIKPNLKKAKTQAALPSKSDIEENIKELEALKAEYKKAPADQKIKIIDANEFVMEDMIEELTTQIKQTRAVMTKAITNAAEASITNEVTAKTQQVLKQQIDSIVKKEGKELEKLNANELQQAYENLYKKMFVPLRQQLQTLNAKRMELAKQTKNPKLTKAETEKAQNELNQCMQKIGTIKQQIQGYNKFVGKIASMLKSKFKKELQPVVVAKEGKKAQLDEFGKAYVKKQTAAKAVGDAKITLQIPKFSLSPSSQPSFQLKPLNLGSFSLQPSQPAAPTNAVASAVGKAVDIELKIDPKLNPERIDNKVKRFEHAVKAKVQTDSDYTALHTIKKHDNSPVQKKEKPAVKNELTNIVPTNTDPDVAEFLEKPEETIEEALKRIDKELQKMRTASSNIRMQINTHEVTFMPKVEIAKGNSSALLEYADKLINQIEANMAKIKDLPPAERAVKLADLKAQLKTLQVKVQKKEKELSEAREAMKQTKIKLPKIKTNLGTLTKKYAALKKLVLAGKADIAELPKLEKEIDMTKAALKHLEENLQKEGDIIKQLMTDVKGLRGKIKGVLTAITKEEEIVKQGPGAKKEPPKAIKPPVTLPKKQTKPALTQAQKTAQVPKVVKQGKGFLASVAALFGNNGKTEEKKKAEKSSPKVAPQYLATDDDIYSQVAQASKAERLFQEQQDHSSVSIGA